MPASGVMRCPANRSHEMSHPQSKRCLKCEATCAPLGPPTPAAHARDRLRPPACRSRQHRHSRRRAATGGKYYKIGGEDTSRAEHRHTQAAPWVPAHVGQGSQGATGNRSPRVWRGVGSWRRAPSRAWRPPITPMVTGGGGGGNVLVPQPGLQWRMGFAQWECG